MRTVTVMINLLCEQAEQATLGSSYIQEYIETVQGTAKPGSYVPAGLAAPMAQVLPRATSQNILP
jgi:hypothetical protein